MLRRTFVHTATLALVLIQLGPVGGLVEAAGAAPAGSTTVASAVSAGYDHTCAILNEGALKCWGRDSFGEVSGPNREGGTYVAVSVGGFHICAIKTDHGVKCWGRDDSGQVSGPNGVGGGGGGGVVALTTGEFHTCAITTDRKLRCWGRDNVGDVSGPNASPAPSSP